MILKSVMKIIFMKSDETSIEFAGPLQFVSNVETCTNLRFQFWNLTLLPRIRGFAMRAGPENAPQIPEMEEAIDGAIEKATAPDLEKTSVSS